jgi:hypothetical protein
MFDVIPLEHLKTSSSAYELPVPAANYPHVGNNAVVRPYNREFLKNAIEDSERRFFDSRIEIWDSDTKWQSSMSAITGHPMFAEIKDMGESAIRLILLRMKDGDVRLHWFPVLYDLVGPDPVAPEKRGYPSEMAKAWVKWGGDTGRI